MSSLGLVTLLVRDYDEAIAFFASALGFVVLEDTPTGDDRRWVVVAPPGDKGAQLLLARALTADQEARVGVQTGGRVCLFLYTDNFALEFERMTEAGVRFEESRREEPYGTVAVFQDLYGNRWDLIEPHPGAISYV